MWRFMSRAVPACTLVSALAFSLAACKSSASFGSAPNTTVAAAGNGSGTTPTTASSTTGATVPGVAANAVAGSVATVGAGGSAPAAAASGVVPPTTAITQGSFTVWTVPANPAQFQDYTIYTQVKLPANTQAYSVSDLSGTIQGTDGYVQPLGGNALQQQFQYSGGTTALMTNMVPGSYTGVQDTINITSVLLKEAQTIQLTFGAGSSITNNNYNGYNSSN